MDALCYAQHGGSGYGFTRADVLDMDVAEAFWFAERLGEHRKDEERAIKSASSARKPA